MLTRQSEPARSLFAPLKRLFTAVVALLATASIAGAQSSIERPDVQIDNGSRAEAITNLAREVESNFPIAEIATATAMELRKRLGQNRYSQTSAKALASTLTADLRALTGDQHFFVDYFVVPRVFPAASGVSDPVSEADRSLALRLHNCGFARVERLEGNVGYIKLDAFETPTVAGQTVTAAMQFLAGTDALIIDLRENGGGYSSMVSLLASYFFAEPVHLTDVSGRDTKQFRQNWTYAFVPGARYLDKPLYILSGARTFSAAEAFAYDLQALKRATIIGEKTRGGVSPSTRLLLSSRFGVVMPTSRVINPATGTNWEGGLKPDVTTSGAEALPAAHLAALESISSGHKNDPLTAEIENAIVRLRREASTAARH